MSPAPRITDLLSRWRAGDPHAEEPLIRETYPELRQLAEVQLRRSPGRLTLRPTELVHEAYLRLARARSLDWQDRRHFFALSAKIMRRLIVDMLRKRGTARRGGGLPFEVYSEHAAGISMPVSVNWLAVDAALRALEKVDTTCARVVELKFFSGLSSEEIATVVGVSEATVRRRWRFAKSWLSNRLAPPDPGSPTPRATSDGR